MKLLLILSSERSGSTLLRVMLGGHNRIVSPSELWLLAYDGYDAWRREKPAAMASLIEYFMMIGRPKGSDEIDAILRGQSIQEVYQWVLNGLPDGKLLVDKTPGYANSEESLQRSLALSPFYVWLVRHPLGVVDSHVRLFRRRHGLRSPRDAKRRVREWIEAACREGMSGVARRREEKWYRQNANIKSFLASVPAERQMCITFEDMVRDPSQSFQVLCRRLDVAFEPGLLAPPNMGHEMLEGLGDVNFSRRRDLDNRTADQWQQRFHEECLRPTTRELMRSLGLGRQERQSREAPRMDTMMIESRGGNDGGLQAGHTLTPVFVLGAKHSGTTVLYRMLALHPRFTWFSQFSQRSGQIPGRRAMPTAVLLERTLNRLFRHNWGKEESSISGLVVPRPSEATQIWQHIVPKRFPVPPEESIRRLRTIFEDQQRAARRDYVLAKLPRLYKWVPVLTGAYPNAKLIHIVRDGRAVALSLKGDYMAGGRRDDMTAVADTGRYWLEVMATLESLKASLDVFELRYEDFCADVHNSLRRLLDYIGIDASAFPFDRCPTTLAETSSTRLHQAPRQELQTLEAMQSDWLRRYGYRPSDLAEPVR